MLRTLTAAFLLAVMPSSSNYVLHSYDFGNGSGTASGTTYKMNGTVGRPSGALSSATYMLPAGIKASTSVSAPAAPTFINASNNYDRLHLTLATSSLPSDTKYLIAISSDGFATAKYVQTDNTIGSVVNINNYQVYAAWGGASGFSILGLASNTTYSVKVAALQGSNTGSGFGPIASAATVSPTVTLALSTSLTSTPPFTTTFSSLAPGTPINGNATLIAAITTNAINGGALAIYDQFGGLKSTAANYTLASASANLSVAQNGYGAQVTTATQTSGGPIVSASPYNGSGNTVGALTTSQQTLASFSNPITNGNITTALIAKTDSSVPSAGDYADTVTLSLSPLF